MFALQDSMKSTCSIADTIDWTGFESNDNRKGLERMCKALFDGESEYVYCNRLYLSIL